MATSHESLPPRPRSSGSLTRLPPVRLASRDELAAAARVAPLLRVARDLTAWAGPARPLAGNGELTPADIAEAAGALDVSRHEVSAAWAVARGTGMAAVADGTAGPGEGLDVLASGRPEEALGLWSSALRTILGRENLDGLATALYTAGRPVRLDALFEAYAAAVGALTEIGREALASQGTPATPGAENSREARAGEARAGEARAGEARAGEARAGEARAGEARAGEARAGEARAGEARASETYVNEAQAHRAQLDPGQPGQDLAGAGADEPGFAELGAPELSPGLELLADLGVVELGAEEADDDAAGLTVALSPLGLWAIRDRLSARGWRVPVLGGSAAGGAGAVLAVLADYDAEDGEAEIAAWLARRSPERAAEELTDAASTGSPGLRGAAFAVLDRVGDAAVPAVRRALDDPVLRPHAAVWLREHGEEASLSRKDSAWLLVDLGAGLLEEAAPEDVVAELLPELPPHAQAELVAGLWQVEHPGVTELLTTLSDHHPEPDVAKAARKAAFKARSRL